MKKKLLKLSFALVTILVVNLCGVFFALLLFILGVDVAELVLDLSVLDDFVDVSSNARTIAGHVDHDGVILVSAEALEEVPQVAP